MHESVEREDSILVLPHSDGATASLARDPVGADKLS